MTGWHISDLREKFDRGRSLTEGEVKLLFFRFNIERNKCQQLSLSGREALTTIADRNELTATGRVQSELFDGVFSEESFFSRSETGMDCMQVLRKFFSQVD